VRILHNLSKEARRQLIDVLLRKRTKSELAHQIGVTPAAMSKYLRGITHPSDEVLGRLVEVADDEEREEIKQIILNDVAKSLREFLEAEEVKEAEELLLKVERRLNSLRVRREDIQYRVQGI
jgi:transcriptional regulator with XRE-family HTH domain